MAATALTTFVFTDLQGSTKLLQELGDDYVSLMAEHHGIVRHAVAFHGGHEIDNSGDSFFLSFDNPREAIAAMVDAQLGLRSNSQLKVRMGIHTGVARRVGDKYVGLAVHHAARVSSAANGRQVLVTDESRCDDLEDVDYVDLGKHRLRDLAEPIRIWQLTHPSLPRDFPPIRSLGLGGGNLPRPRTSFFGRKDDIDRMGAALSRPGLLTLIAPGGCGKTRLAVEGVKAHAQDFPGGTWFVELQAVSDPVDVMMSLARSLGVPVADATTPLLHIIARLGAEPAVVVLDTCEHLVEACAELSERLLDACPELRIVATSRELLGLSDEVAQRVPSLPIAGAAVDLFCERARRVNPSFAPDTDTADQIARICARLDGIPLAIELAAARMRHFTPSDLEGRLDDRLRVLTGSERHAMQRHQTLEALVGWSYDMLTAEEASLLRALSVFAGSFGARAAQAVCLADTAILLRLVDRSLVEVADGSRFRLLETVRLFAQQRLAEAGETEDVRGSHAAWCMVEAQAGAGGVRGTGFSEALWAFEDAAQDVRSALDWMLRSGRIEAATQLAAAVGWIAGWTSTGAALAKLVEEALELDVGDVLSKARLELAGAMLRWAQQDPITAYGARARRHFEEAGATDDPLYGWALFAQGAGRTWGREPDAKEPIVRALQFAEADGDHVLAVYATAALGWAHQYEGDFSGAREHWAHAATVARTAGNDLIRAWVGFWSGIGAMKAEDWSVAWSSYEEALPVFRRLGNKIPLQWTLDHLSHAARELGDIESARAFTEEGIALSRDTGLATGSSNYPDLLMNAASFEGMLGRHAQAAMYLDEALDLLRAADEPDTQHYLVEVLATLAAERSVLGEQQSAIRLASEAVARVRDLEVVPLESGGVVDPPVEVALQAASRVAKEAGAGRRAAVLHGAARAIEAASGGARRGMQRGPRWYSGVLGSSLSDELRAALGEGFDAALAEGEHLADPLKVAAETLVQITPIGMTNRTGGDPAPGAGPVGHRKHR